jgi:hypothetical protein
MIRILTLLTACLVSAPALAKPTISHTKPKAESAQFYRDLILRVRTEGEFRIPMADRGDQFFRYKMEIDTPKWTLPVVSEDTLVGVIDFWDKIMLKDGSFIVLNGEEIPLTCIHVKGRDLGKSGIPTVPRFIITFFFVANDWTCTGPMNPDYPKFSPRKDAWDTYLHYDVRDETIMLPSEVGLRYHWNEFDAQLVR